MEGTTFALNGASRTGSAQVAFHHLCQPEIGSTLSISSAPYDAVVFEMEHNPVYDITMLRHCLQYLLNRRSRSRLPAA